MTRKNARKKSQAASRRKKPKASTRTDSLRKEPDYSPTPQPNYSFLDLPSNVRTKIYEYAGFLRPCIIRPDFEPTQRLMGQTNLCLLQNRSYFPASGPKSLGAPNKVCKHPPIPVQMLRVSRAVQEDVGSFFASRNSFGTVLSYKNDLERFETSMGWAFPYIKRLHIELRAGDQRYLKNAVGGTHGTTWKMWGSFCKLAGEKMPSLMAFSLKCKIKDYDAAERLFVDMDGFPLLTNCALHLNTVPNDKVFRRVQRASWDRTTLSSSLSFPFMRLPMEIRLIVLKFLLTGHSDPYVRCWGKLYGVEMQSSQGIVTFQNRQKQRVNDEYPLTCCGTCSPTRSMCFCSSRQCSYSTSCSCFTSPVPYFRVSHHFSRIASDIFFSRNLFAFVEESPDAMLRIINNVSTQTLQQIRLLAFVFPSTFRLAMRPAHRAEDIALASWSVLRRFLREHFDLARLTLCVMDFGNKSLSATMELTNRKRYLRRVVTAFADLPNLRDFWVYLMDDHEFEEEARRTVLGRHDVIEQPFPRRALRFVYN